MPTQLNGRTSDMAAIQSIADQYGLDIYEDAAQALGSKFKGQYAGTFGKAACISFYPAKILGCLGDGGLILTSDREIYDKLLLLRDHGRSNDGDIPSWGFNTRLDNLQAAFLNFQFDNYDQVIKRRRGIAAQYQEFLKDVDQIQLPPDPDTNSDYFDVYQNYEIEAQQRDKLKAFLAENGIGTLIQWGGKAVHQFAKLGFDHALPYTEKVFTRLLMLPLNMSITDTEVNYVAEKISEFYRKKRKI
jgi:dTDP-4-amino-4,6-dideoxygalactose transaminase